MLQYFKNNTIVARCKYGQKVDGVQLGGNAICDEFNITPKIVVNETCFHELSGMSSNGYVMTSTMLENMNRNNVPTMLCGGDHSIGISSSDAMLNIYGDDLRILWIDAHADINDYDSSHSGNIHGMPLGFHHEGTRNYVPWQTSDKQRRLKSKQLFYLGIRDLDRFEVNLIERYNIMYTNNINEELLCFLASAPKLMISFDVDSIDPEYMSSTGTIAKNGLSPETIKYILNYCLRNNNLVHLDITEFNPLLGNIKTSLECLHTIFD